MLCRMHWAVRLEQILRVSKAHLCNSQHGMRSASARESGLTLADNVMSDREGRDSAGGSETAGAGWPRLPVESCLPVRRPWVWRSAAVAGMSRALSLLRACFAASVFARMQSHFLSLPPPVASPITT